MGVARPNLRIANRQPSPAIIRTIAPVDLQKMVVTNSAKIIQPESRLPIFLRAPVNHIQIPRIDALVIHMPSINPLAIKP